MSNTPLPHEVCRTVEDLHKVVSELVAEGRGHYSLQAFSQMGTIGTRVGVFVDPKAREVGLHPTR